MPSIYVGIKLTRTELIHVCIKELNELMYAKVEKYINEIIKKRDIELVKNVISKEMKLEKSDICEAIVGRTGEPCQFKPIEFTKYCARHKRDEIVEFRINNSGKVLHIPTGLVFNERMEVIGHGLKNGGVKSLTLVDIDMCKKNGFYMIGDYEKREDSKKMEEYKKIENESLMNLLNEMVNNMDIYININKYIQRESCLATLGSDKYKEIRVYRRNI
jgi:hypothetical protein